MLKKKRKDKDRAEKELRTLTDKFNDKSDNQFQGLEEKQRKMKVQMQQLQEQNQ